MKKEEMFSLSPATKILHHRYGPAEVLEIVPEFGAVIQPLTEAGKRLLCADSGAIFGTPLLENSNERMDFITGESVRQFNP